MGKRKVSHTSDGEIDTVKDEFEDGVKDGVDMEGDVSMKSISEGGDEESAAEVKVIGEILKKSGGNGKADKKLYEAFEVDGNRYEIGEGSLTWPEVADTAVEVVSAVERMGIHLQRKQFKSHLITRKCRQLECEGHQEECAHVRHLPRKY